VIGSASSNGQRHAVTRMAAVRPRQRVTVIGTVRSTGEVAIGTSRTFQCRIADGSGEIDLLFLGQQQVAGLTPGRRCTAEGMASVYREHLVIWNPRYELEPADPPHEGTGVAPDGQPGPGRVVLVHDDLGLGRIIEINLATRGYEVIAGGTATPAECSDLGSADLIVVDLGLTGAAGIKTVGLAREASAAPILAISALRDEGVRQAVLAAGADDILVKPFPIGVLLTRVAEYLEDGGRGALTLHDHAG
jgi:CheY-like chemotaxis protein